MYKFLICVKLKGCQSNEIKAINVWQLKNTSNQQILKWLLFSFNKTIDMLKLENKCTALNIIINFYLARNKIK